MSVCVCVCLSVCVCVWVGGADLGYVFVCLRAPVCFGFECVCRGKGNEVGNEFVYHVHFLSGLHITPAKIEVFQI